MAGFNAHVLYSGDSMIPIVCERKDWKKCPQHKGLSKSRPHLKVNAAGGPTAWALKEIDVHDFDSYKVSALDYARMEYDSYLSDRAEQNAVAAAEANYRRSGGWLGSLFRRGK